jgi:hypothetical protein
MWAFGRLRIIVTVFPFRPPRRKGIRNVLRIDRSCLVPSVYRFCPENGVPVYDPGEDRVDLTFRKPDFTSPIALRYAVRIYRNVVNFPMAQSFPANPRAPSKFALHGGWRGATKEATPIRRKVLRIHSKDR